MTQTINRGIFKYRRRMGGIHVTPLPLENWAHLYARYGDEVKNYFITQTGCPHDAEDLAQDVFMGLLCCANLPENVHAYIRTVTRNRLRRYWRQKTRDADITQEETLSNVAGRYSQAPTSHGQDPFEQLARRDMSTFVTCVLSQIPATLAQAIKLRFIAELSLEEASRKLGCTQGALKKRLQRAKRLVAQSCGPEAVSFLESKGSLSRANSVIKST